MFKKSISLPNHILTVAEQEAKKHYGGSLSLYIQTLIGNDKKDEADKEFAEEEANKPKNLHQSIKAQFTSICPVCNRKIYKGQKIFNAKFKDGHEQFVHNDCCK